MDESGTNDQRAEGPGTREQLPDEQLMVNYARGDVGAFDELYSRYRGSAYRFILRQVGNPAVANDLYQASWEKIIRAQQRYQPKAPFRAWLFTIVRRVVVDHYRRNRGPGESIEDLPGPGSQEPERVTYEHQQQQRLAAAIAELSPEQREAILLKLEAGLSLEEIADATGVGRETAKSRIRYALAHLQARLQDQAPSRDTVSGIATGITGT